MKNPFRPNGGQYELVHRTTPNDIVFIRKKTNRNVDSTFFRLKSAIQFAKIARSCRGMKGYINGLLPVAYAIHTQMKPVGRMINPKPLVMLTVEDYTDLERQAAIRNLPLELDEHIIAPRKEAIEIYKKKRVIVPPPEEIPIEVPAIQRLKKAAKALTEG